MCCPAWRGAKRGGEKFVAWVLANFTQVARANGPASRLDIAKMLVRADLASHRQLPLASTNAILLLAAHRPGRPSQTTWTRTRTRTGARTGKNRKCASQQEQRAFEKRMGARRVGRRCRGGIPLAEAEQSSVADGHGAASPWGAEQTAGVGMGWRVRPEAPVFWPTHVLRCVVVPPMGLDTRQRLDGVWADVWRTVCVPC